MKTGRPTEQQRACPDSPDGQHEIVTDRALGNECLWCMATPKHLHFEDDPNSCTILCEE